MSYLHDNFNLKLFTNQANFFVKRFHSLDKYDNYRKKTLV